MKNRIKLVGALLGACLMLTACTGGAGETRLSFPTAATTGALYPLGASLATVWNEEVEGVKVTSEASGGGVDNLNFLYDGEAQLGFAVTSIMYESFYGTGTFEGRENKDLRVLAGLYYNPNQVVVTKDSSIEKLSDIKGKRFAPGAPGSTTCVEAELHLLAAGLNYPDDFTAEFVGFTESTDLIRNRQLDGAWIMAGIPNAAVTEITGTAGGRLISIDSKIIDKLKENYPWYANYTIPAGTYAGQDEDINTSAIKLALFTTAKLDEDTVYKLTKSFWENVEAIAQTNKALSGVTVEGAVMDLAGLPIHEGALKYYREIGIID